MADIEVILAAARKRIGELEVQNMVWQAEIQELYEMYGVKDQTTEGEARSDEGDTNV